MYWLIFSRDACNSSSLHYDTTACVQHFIRNLEKIIEKWHPISQVPRDHVDDFTSVRKFKIFNTNNLWISLPAIKRVIDDENLEMEVIVNPKTLDNGVNVVQLEEAVGAAIKCFEGSMSEYESKSLRW